MKYSLLCALLASTITLLGSCKSSSTDAAITTDGSRVDLRGTWVESNTDELHRNGAKTALVTFTITSNAKGTIGTATYPAINVSYPLTMDGHDSVWTMSWGPGLSFGAPTGMCAMTFGAFTIKQSGTDSVLAGYLSYTTSFSNYWAGGGTTGMSFTKAK